MAPINDKVTLSTSLPTISLLRLEAGDANESAALLQACSSHGFFYLNLQGADTLLGTWRSLLSVIADYFDQPVDHKMNDARESDNQG